MKISQQIHEKLSSAFTPESLEVVDESEQHRGHGGWREGGETHFRVTIVSAKFEGMSRVQRHRAVNEVLAHELGEGGVHALSVSAQTP